MRFTRFSRFIFPSLTLLSVLATSSLASTVIVNPTDNVVGKVRAAAAGDVIQFAAGTFNIRTPVLIPSGVTLQGAPSFGSHLVFNIAGGEDTSYAFNIVANAQNVTIQGLDMVSNHGLVAMCYGSLYRNVQITRNNIQYGGGQFKTGYLVFGVYAAVRSDGLQVTHNYFHDSMDGSSRNWCVWSSTNANLDYNLFNKVNDGGQINCPGTNTSCDYNYGTGIHRMGQEVSLQSNIDFECKGNVFYDYILPYFNSDGLSIVGGWGPVDITNNYIKASIAPGSTWGEADRSGAHRFGYCMEITGRPANISGNTMVGTWAGFVVSDSAGALATGNSLFGYGLWGNFAGEGGHFGYGSVIASGNTIKGATAAPAVPVNNFAGPQF